MIPLELFDFLWDYNLLLVDKINTMGRCPPGPEGEFMYFSFPSF
jgi:hypothetical protein